ncbi:hypothetical protein JXB01_01635 [Candidatus Micrarchaeota archaeon]|nr:hypothetical protein [Candidatus Micrarchaeota archaeon]
MKDKKKKSLKPSEKSEMVKRAEKIILKIKEGKIVVEGKRDKESLKRLGASSVTTSAGKPFYACEKLSRLNAEEVIILTDLDRKGEQLLKFLERELWSRGIKTDVKTRKEISGILKIRDFENIDKKYEEFKKS